MIECEYDVHGKLGIYFSSSTLGLKKHKYVFTSSSQGDQDKRICIQAAFLSFRLIYFAQSEPLLKRHKRGECVQNKDKPIEYKWADSLHHNSKLLCVYFQNSFSLQNFCYIYSSSPFLYLNNTEKEFETFFQTFLVKNVPVS